MRLEKDDPRIIDFALGELDEEEHQAIAEALEAKENAAARAALGEFDQVVGAAVRALEQEEKVVLGIGQREEILAQAESSRRVRSWFSWVPLRPALAIGLMLVVGGGLILVTLPDTFLTRTEVISSALNPEKLPALRALEEIEQKEQEAYALHAQKKRIITESYGESRRNQISSDALPSDVRQQMEALGYLGDETVSAMPSSEPPPRPAPEPVAARPIPPAADAAGAHGISGLQGRSRINGGHEIALQNFESALTVDRRASAAAQSTHTYDDLDFGVEDSNVDNDGLATSSHSWRMPGNSELYARVVENAFKRVSDAPLSTFSVDVDTASYSNVRRFLTQGQFPPPDAVRIEELLNYFDYDYPQPEDGRPFAVDVTAGPCPWRPEHLLAKIGLQGYTMPASERPRGNFVFLLDVSGSMNAPNKLPLVKESMRALLGELRPDDRVGIVTYASRSAVPLRSTPCSEKTAIERAIESLGAGGSTHGSAGIRDAYTMARNHFIKGGVNRVILATDGDFNVGVTNHEELMQLIAGEAKSNVFLTALGFGMGNIKDQTLEQLADRGNGHYAYIDDFKEARKVLVDQLNGGLVTIAKDVKIQVEFNPAQVGAYRLIGYENRVLAAKDFNDDTKDAGEIGAGHTVTALYEIVPPGASPAPGVDPLKYQDAPPLPETDTPQSDELMTVKLRWKEPEGDTSAKIEVPVRAVTQRSRDLDFAASVASFGMLLRGSQYSGNATWTLVRDLAEAGQNGGDTRSEYLDLVIKAKTMASQ